MHFPEIPDFNIDKIIAFGGCSVIFSAIDLKRKIRVAIKIPQQSKTFAIPTLDHLFIREINICSKIRHPNIVRYLKQDTKTQPADFSDEFAVFEFIPGITLKEYLVKKGALSLPETYHILQQILRAMTYLHRMNIAHGDIKPKNIMISTAKNGTFAKLIDFGSAAEIPKNLETTSNTKDTTYFFNGTLDYASPHRINGAPPTPESDIYSWCLLFLECLLGYNPKFLSKNGKYYISIPTAIERIPIVKSLTDYLSTYPFLPASRATSVFKSLQCATPENDGISLDRNNILSMEDTVIIPT